MHQTEQKNVVLPYVDYYVSWYTLEKLGKLFVDTIGDRFHANFLGYAHWFMSTRISQMKDHYISVDQSRYTTSIVAKYLDTATVKTSTKFYKTNLSRDIIFTRADASISDEQL